MLQVCILDLLSSFLGARKELKVHEYLLKKTSQKARQLKAVKALPGGEALGF
jgi:hypothetical protein